MKLHLLLRMVLVVLVCLEKLEEFPFLATNGHGVKKLETKIFKFCKAMS
jgi:hypothetical protein